MLLVKISIMCPLQFLKKFEELIQIEYPSLSKDKSDRTFKEPLTFAQLDAALKVVCNSSWRRVVDQQTVHINYFLLSNHQFTKPCIFIRPIQISKDSVDLPITGSFKPEELHTYPPRMVCQFYPEQGAMSTTCTLTLHGFDKLVNVDIALLISKPQVTLDTNKLQVIMKAAKLLMPRCTVKP